MFSFDDYVIDVLMRDLVGHDRRPVAFLVYLWLAAEAQRRNGAVQISYREIAESIGVSKSSVQAAISRLTRRKLLAATKETVTAAPCYTVLSARPAPHRKTSRRAT
jgi:DNA-binding transcriptional MocR family regulator